VAPYDASVIADLSQVAVMSGNPNKGLEWIDFAATRDPSAAKDMNYKKRMGFSYTREI
jgi:hypothetical protein